MVTILRNPDKDKIKVLYFPKYKLIRKQAKFHTNRERFNRLQARARARVCVSVRVPVYETIDISQKCCIVVEEFFNHTI